MTTVSFTSVLGAGLRGDCTGVDRPPVPARRNSPLADDRCVIIGRPCPPAPAGYGKTGSRQMRDRYSSLTERIGGRGANAWEIHRLALEARARGEDAVVLSVGDPEFDTPAPVVEAAKRALDSGDTHYTAMRGRDDLRALIAARHRLRTGQAVEADNVVVVPGAQAGLFCAALILAEAGDEIVTTDPVYTTYEATIRAGGARVVAVPLDRDRGFDLDAGRLERAMNARTRAIFLANPNNPTGTVLSAAAMDAVATLAER